MLLPRYMNPLCCDKVGRCLHVLGLYMTPDTVVFFGGDYLNIENILNKIYNCYRIEIIYLPSEIPKQLQ